MWAYVVTFGVSVVLVVRDSRRLRREAVIMRSTYGQVPQLDIQDYRVTTDLQDLPSSVEECVYTSEGVFT